MLAALLPNKSTQNTAAHSCAAYLHLLADLNPLRGQFRQFRVEDGGGGVVRDRVRGLAAVAQGEGPAQPIATLGFLDGDALARSRQRTGGGNQP